MKNGINGWSLSCSFIRSLHLRAVAHLNGYIPHHLITLRQLNNMTMRKGTILIKGGTIVNRGTLTVCDLYL